MASTTNGTGPAYVHHSLMSVTWASDRGNLWVRESAETDGAVDLWSVFDPDGRLAGRLRVSEGLEILDIRDGRVLGVIEDGMGVERAEVYRIVEPAAAEPRDR